MKLKFDKHESDMLQLIKAHTGCETRSAVALLADLKHLESGNIAKMSVKVSGTNTDADKMVNKKKNFFF